MDSFRLTTSHLTGSEVLCWILEGVSPSAAPSDVERVVGSVCKSGNVAGQCGRMLGGCERALSSGVGSVVWLPVLEVQYWTGKTAVLP